MVCVLRISSLVEQLEDANFKACLLKIGTLIFDNLRYTGMPRWYRNVQHSFQKALVGKAHTLVVHRQQQCNKITHLDGNVALQPVTPALDDLSKRALTEHATYLVSASETCGMQDQQRRCTSNAPYATAGNKFIANADDEVPVFVVKVAVLTRFAWACEHGMCVVHSQFARPR